jgi:predicted Ser/Thr protein kinase
MRLAFRLEQCVATRQNMGYLRGFRNSLCNKRRLKGEARMNSENDPFQTVTPDSPGHAGVSTTTAPAEPDKDIPERIGRYHIEKILGEGGFGQVYLAYDEELQRHVAVKVPRASRISRPEDVESFLAEARTLAHLDHPNIVPVHDLGRTEDGLCFVVSKLIQGSDLSKKMKAARLSLKESVELVITVAEALHYAHHAGLVHRDIKPANILIDTTGKAYVADFGLALKEEDYGKGAGFAGTPAYMSPEQARGECRDCTRRHRPLGEASCDVIRGGLVCGLR